MPEHITLYDIRSHFDEEGKEPILWSPNVWRARFVLNIKAIPHRTEYVDLIDVQNAMKQLGASPTLEVFDQDFYSVPTIYDSSTGKVVTDSQMILGYLEAQYPDSPSLFPPNTKALQTAFIELHFNKWIHILYPLLCAKLYEHCTPESSRVYFKTSRSAYFNKDWELLQAKGEERDLLIQEFLQVLGELTGWVEENGKEALFLTGSTVSNADVHIAAVLMWIKRVAGTESDIWNAVAAANDGRWITFMDAFEKYAVVH